MSSQIYGPATPEPPPALSVIDGRMGRKLSNALTMKFHEGAAEEPFATAVQCAGGGTGAKLGVLFGFKNGSPGAHVVTYADGSTLTVPTLAEGPTTVTLGDGAVVATLTRGATTAAATPDGSTVLSFLPDPVEPATSARDRLRVLDGGGAHLATMDVIKPGGGYDTGDLIEAVDFVMSGFQGQTGGALPLPRIGVRTILHRQPSPLERDVLVAAAVELGIGLRRYVTEMP